MIDFIRSLLESALKTNPYLEKCVITGCLRISKESIFTGLNNLKYGYRNPTGFRRWVKVAESGGLCYTCVMGTWKSKNRHKYLLQYHIIFVCKYRKKLLMSKQISDIWKQIKTIFIT